MKSDQRPESRAQYWQQQVNAWSETELSGAKFCQSQGLVYHQFVYWRQKLLKPSPPKTDGSLASGFSQVSYQPTELSGLTLSLPNGIEVRGVDASNVSIVQSLLAAM